MRGRQVWFGVKVERNVTRIPALSGIDVYSDDALVICVKAHVDDVLIRVCVLELLQLDGLLFNVRLILNSMYPLLVLLHSASVLFVVPSIGMVLVVVLDVAVAISSTWSPVWVDHLSIIVTHCFKK